MGLWSFYVYFNYGFDPDTNIILAGSILFHPDLGVGKGRVFTPPPQKIYKNELNIDV